MRILCNSEETQRTNLTQRTIWEYKNILPLLSISFIHFSTTTGMGDFLAFITVVRSCPKIDFTNLMSGIQSFGTFSEHFLWASNPQSVKYDSKFIFFHTCEPSSLFKWVKFFQKEGDFRIHNRQRRKFSQQKEGDFLILWKYHLREIFKNLTAERGFTCMYVTCIYRTTWL